MNRRFLILASLGAAGALSGFAGRQFAGSHPVGRHQLAATHAASEITPTPPPALRSADTAVSIQQAAPQAEYPRLAAWLATADAGEIAEYWAGYHRGPRVDSLTELIFIHWTRHDPRAAIAAVAGTMDERYPWWAWSASDPAAALAAARTPLEKSEVARGIGDFQPAWLRAHFQDLPEECRAVALNHMTRWTAGQDPQTTLDFLREHPQEDAGAFFEKLVRDDPWAAVDWLKQNPTTNRDPFRSIPDMDLLISTLAESHPEDLERLAAHTPPGADRRAMDRALFELLLTADPAAALEKARAAESPLLAAQMLSRIGLETFASNPEQAFAIAAEILAANSGKIAIDHRVSSPDGTSSTFVPNEMVRLIEALYSRDRGRTLDLLSVPAASGAAVSPTFEAVADSWVTDDIAGFGEWAGRQTGAIFDVSAGQLSRKLAEQGRFAEAIEWLDASQLDPNLAYSGVLLVWNQTDAQAAEEWLENSGLTPSQKAIYRERLDRSNR